jgi:hypothetical protein
MNAQTLGKALKRYFRSDRAYELLDSSKETKGTSWQSGGCWPLAEALHSLLPGSELVAVVSDGVQHHVLVNLHGWYLDADGASSQRALLSRWHKQEGLQDPTVALFKPAQTQDLVCPVQLVQRLRVELSRLIALA